MQVWPLQEEPPQATSEDDYAELAKCRACEEFVPPMELDRAGLCSGCSAW